MQYLRPNRIGKYLFMLGGLVFSAVFSLISVNSGQTGHNKAPIRNFGDAFLLHASADTPSGDTGCDGGSTGGGGGGGGATGGTGGSCFRGDTFVGITRKDDGSIVGKPIAEIRAGESILGADYDTAAQIYRTVLTRVERAFTSQEIAVRFASLTCENGSAIECTSSHPFIIGPKNQSRAAGELLPQTRLTLASRHSFIWSRVLQKTYWTERATVWHLTTGTSNFLVSRDGSNYFLVHNKAI